MGFQKNNDCWKLRRHKSKHGMCNSRLYKCWHGMKNRCDGKNRPGYHRYGGRGITYCDEWKEFLPFMKWALTHGYSDDLTLDRIDNDGNYCPENCKWSTQKEQAQNKKKKLGKSGMLGIRQHFTHNKKTGENVFDGYFAVVTINGKQRYCGYSKTAQGAYEKRQKFIEEHHDYFV